MTIAHTSEDSSGGRDQVIETNWAKENCELGIGKIEIAEKKILSALSVYANEVDMLK